MSKKKTASKAELKAAAIAAAMHAGEPCDCETVDFSDPNRPPTCLEVDFPILPINQIAAIEGNAGKPIYQMSKWWARRRSSVFRSLLIAAAMKAPDDAGLAAKQVWDAYYRNHQINGVFKDIKVADIFMGGGTTIVEGSRLGMQMYGNDYNPVAWFVVKNEMATVDRKEVEKALADIEAEVKPQIMPFYACDCPRGHKGKWTHIASGQVMDEAFDPLALSPEERKQYSYYGPETIYVFWAKHGPCQVRGCGHRTPIMSSPVMAEKELSVKYWERKCSHCGGEYDIEAGDPRMAPGVPLVRSEAEKPFAPGRFGDLPYPGGACCPLCGGDDVVGTRLPKAKSKKVQLYLLVHPEWLSGESSVDPDGNPYGGSAGDSPESTAAWNRARAAKCRLVEVRGELPEEIACPDSSVKFSTHVGTVPKKSHYSCSRCGTVQDVLKSVKATEKTGPVAIYAIQGYCPECDEEKHLYNGRFFAPLTDSSSYDSAILEWFTRKKNDLNHYWPPEQLSYGWKTHGWGIPEHGYTHYWKMFNARQLLVLSSLLKAIQGANISSPCREFILGAFQQYLRNQNMFCFWDISRDCMAPHLSRNNFHPKNNVVENCVFPSLGRGNWTSTIESLGNTLEWMSNPWDIAHNDTITKIDSAITGLTGKSEKVYPHDSLHTARKLTCGSSTELAFENLDLIITDPPFGDNIQYSELSDFFYVWLRLALKDAYPNEFGPEYTPKTLEAVANRARHPEGPDAFYKLLLTGCWQSAHRALKPGGLMAFTFHHSAFEPWIAVLESLFEAGFVLVATYPIRSDESKGGGAFGSQKIEFDIIHVCRKRTGEPDRVSWPKMRRAIMDDVAGLKDILELHQKEGLPEADLQVIRIGKALEYYSRHYGKVYKNDDETLSVKEALAGIMSVIDDSDGEIVVRPPDVLEPATRIFLSLFDNREALPRDQMQKSLRHTGIAPDEYEQRGWCAQEKKIYNLVSPLEIANKFRGQKRQRISNDYDQAALLVGACYEHSGIRVQEIFDNPNFHPHRALGPLLEWLKTHGATADIRNAAAPAHELFKKWTAKETYKDAQGKLF